ncbi:MAG: putative holin-like toxin [Thermincolia bacterium]
MTVFEALTLIVLFSSLVVAIISVAQREK